MELLEQAEVARTEQLEQGVPLRLAGRARMNECSLHLASPRLLFQLPPTRMLTIMLIPIFKRMRIHTAALAQLVPNLFMAAAAVAEALACTALAAVGLQLPHYTAGLRRRAATTTAQRARLQPHQAAALEVPCLTGVSQPLPSGGAVQAALVLSLAQLGGHFRVHLQASAAAAAAVAVEQRLAMARFTWPWHQRHIQSLAALLLRLPHHQLVLGPPCQWFQSLGEGQLTGMLLYDCTILLQPHMMSLHHPLPSRHIFCPSTLQQAHGAALPAGLIRKDSRAQHDSPAARHRDVRHPGWARGR